MSKVQEMTAEKLAGYMDHTLLKAYVKDEDFKKLCEDAAKYRFAMVAINSFPVAKCKEYLKGSGVHVGAAISFPLGQTTIACKTFETKQAIADGADEIDYVVNLVELKNGNLAYVEDEMKQIVSICREKGIISKVIFENCYLTDDEKKQLCGIACKVRPDFIKTSTGFGTGGATIEDVRLMKAESGGIVKVKAAGGIRDLDTALAMIEAGAERIGTSASVKIMEEFIQRAGT